MAETGKRRWSGSAGLAAAGLVFGVAASLAYVLGRVYERVRTPVQADPTLILRTLHTDFYYRAAMSVWIGVVFGVFAYRLTRGADSESTATTLGWLLVATACAAVPLSFLLP